MPTPTTLQITEIPETTDSREARLVGDLLTLARNAHQNANPADQEDYWFRLGQRNAYAFATGLLPAPTLRADVFVIADRVNAALSDGVTDLTALRALVYSAQTPTPAKATTAPTRLQWVGPHAFSAVHLTGPGVEADFGSRWGDRADRRVSFRTEAGAHVGLLYAYDPTWDEYAVLAHSVTRAQVAAAFSVAHAFDAQMDVDRFADLVHAAATSTDLTPVVGEPALLTHEALL